MYSAPEFLPSSKEQKPKYDCQVDVWSLACIVFNLFTGVPPFFEDDQAKLFEQIHACNYMANIVSPFLFSEPTSVPSTYT